MTNLKKILKEKGIKSKDLAIMVRVLPTSVSHHVCHGIKTIRIAKRYAKVLGCNPFDLMDV